MAKLRDIPQLVELLTELFTLELDFKPDPVRQARGVRQIIQKPEVGCILVARDGGRIAGMVTLLFTISTAEGGWVILLEDMIVRAEYRGQGVGSALLTQAIEFAQNRGISRITLLMDRCSEKAIRFYGRHGFEASGMAPMRLNLARA